MSACTRFCAADIGSNSIKVRIVEVTEGLRKILFDARYPIRLGTSVFESGELKQDDIDATVGAFEEVAALCKNYGVLRTRIVATSAMREASNKDDVVEKVHKLTGLRIEVISGTEEARLLAIGLKPDMKEDSHNLILDIGGGSTELIYTTTGHNIETMHSVRLGAVRLQQMISAESPISKKNYAVLETCVLNVLEKCHLPVIAKKTHVVGVGGAMRAIADVMPSGSDSFSAKELEKMIKTFRDLSHDELVKQFGVDARRAPIMLPGMLIVGGVLDLYSIEQVTVSGRGLRDGLLEDVIEKTEAISAPDLFSFAFAVGAKYNFDEAHARHVAALAVSLYDQLNAVHKLSPEYRELLYIAALLHDIGQFINYSKHHKHSLYLIRNEDFANLSQQQQEIVAVIARYHRKSAPKIDHPEFAALAPDVQTSIAMCSALLRIADALDRGHRQLVEAVTVDSSRDSVVLTVSSSQHVFLELSAAKKKGQYFEKESGRKLTISEAMRDEEMEQA
jgi:exopolyphosphatase / guanosine-5'-triphosphate,3'-diphosphate pyrophosphatase